MHVGTYPTRHLATLRESELLPAFSGPWPGWTRVLGTATGQDSEAVHTLSGLRPPMFLVNSRDPLVTATCGPTSSVRPQAPLIPRLRGQFAEFPRPQSTRYALGFSPRDTCVGSRYGHEAPLPGRLHGLPGSTEPAQWPAILGSPRFSSLRPSPRLARLDEAMTSLGLPGSYALGCAPLGGARVTSWHRNINRFPCFAKLLWGFA